MNSWILALILIVLAIIAAGLIRTNIVHSRENQQLFLAGKLPENPPSGFFTGKVTGLKTQWQGKRFNPATETGINKFGYKDKYPFKTYVGKGLVDNNKDVFKIDYNVAENPLLFRLIVDEVVETSPNHLLGKLTIRFLPGINFALGFFELEK